MGQCRTPAERGPTEWTLGKTTEENVASQRMQPWLSGPFQGLRRTKKEPMSEGVRPSL
jgi:hypothetical protein